MDDTHSSNAVPSVHGTNGFIRFDVAVLVDATRVRLDITTLEVGPGPLAKAKQLLISDSGVFLDGYPGYRETDARHVRIWQA